MVFPLHCCFVYVNRNQEDKKNDISVRKGYWKYRGTEERGQFRRVVCVWKKWSVLLEKYSEVIVGYLGLGRV